jgi:hypothetical protein
LRIPFRVVFVLLCDDIHLGADLYGTLDASGNRTALGMEAVHAFDDGSVHARVDLERVTHVNALDDENLALEFDLAFGVGPEATASGGDVARFERAPERADQSTGRRGYDVVERGRVRRRVVRGHAVMLGDLAVHPERDLLVLSGQCGVPQRSFDSLDPDARPVGHLTHGSAPFVASIRP